MRAPTKPPVKLRDCDAGVWLALDVAAAAGPVEEVEPVGFGRWLKLEIGRDDERDWLLIVVDEDELELEPEEVSDEPMAVA